MKHNNFIMCSGCYHWGICFGRWNIDRLQWTCYEWIFLMRKWVKIKSIKCLGRNQQPKIEIKKSKWGILRDEVLGILWIWKQHEWFSVETEPSHHSEWDISLLNYRSESQKTTTELLALESLYSQKRNLGISGGWLISD